MSIDLIMKELAFIDASIWTIQLAKTIFLSIFEVPFIARSVGESLSPLPMRLVILPLTFIRSAIFILAKAFTVHLIVLPVTLVLGPISLNIVASPVPLASQVVSKKV